MSDTKKTEAPTGSPVTPATPGATTDKSNAQPNNPAPGPQSTKTLTPTGTAVKAPEGDETPKNAPSDNTPDEAPELSAEEQAKLEKILDGDEDRYHNSDGTVKIDDGDSEDIKKGKTAWNKIVKLVTLIPKDTPDEHVVWGAAGIRLELGDLRALVRRG